MPGQWWAPQLKAPRVDEQRPCSAKLELSAVFPGVRMNSPKQRQGRTDGDSQNPQTSPEQGNV